MKKSTGVSALNALKNVRSDLIAENLPVSLPGPRNTSGPDRRPDHLRNLAPMSHVHWSPVITE